MLGNRGAAIGQNWCAAIWLDLPFVLAGSSTSSLGWCNTLSVGMSKLSEDIVFGDGKTGRIVDFEVFYETGRSLPYQRNWSALNSMPGSCLTSPELNAHVC